MKTDPLSPMLDTLADVTMTPTQMRREERVRVPRCPCCGMPHPSDVACKPGERYDTGPDLSADPWTW